MALHAQTGSSNNQAQESVPNAMSGYNTRVNTKQHICFQLQRKSLCVGKQGIFIIPFKLESFCKETFESWKWTVWGNILPISRQLH